MVRLVALIMISLLVISCGSGGGDGLPSGRPSVDITGYAVDAVIQGGEITAYGWDNGEKGARLGSAKTDENGYFQISVVSEAQPVLLELTEGAYTEDSSGTNVNLQDDVLCVVINFDSKDIEVVVTPFTHIAAALAEYYTNDGATAQDAITRATEEISTITTLNIHYEYPLNITQQKNETDQLTDGHMYGFLCAALSSWAAELSTQNETDVHSIYTGIYLSQLMYLYQNEMTSNQHIWNLLTTPTNNLVSCLRKPMGLRLRLNIWAREIQGRPRA